MENANTNISVWWDIESCPIPTNFEGHYYIAKNILLALSNANFHGKVSISAYGNTDVIPSEVHDALYCTGISVYHAPTGGGYQQIKNAIFTWMLNNPAPANILLISGNDSFSDLLHSRSIRRPLNTAEQMVTIENANTNISVWWDIESCPIPTNFDGIDYIAKNIPLALSNTNLHGKLSISAYGNTDLIPGEVQNALQRTGISLHHVPTGGGYEEIMNDMIAWMLDNHPPANFLLISGDDSFSELLHNFSLIRYNILLSGPSQLDESLTSAANVIWLWPTLISGGRPLNIAEQLPSSSSSSQVQGGESSI